MSTTESPALHVWICRVCKERFDTERGLHTHFGLKCKGRLESWTSSDCCEPPAIDVGRGASQRIFQGNMHQRVLHDLTCMRYDKFMASSHMDGFKTAIAEWLQDIRVQLKRCLSKVVQPGMHDVANAIIDETTDVFHGIDTAAKEAASLRKTLPLLDLQPRLLGKRTVCRAARPSSRLMS